MARHPEIVAPCGRVRGFTAPEAASQSFVSGNFVYISGGKVAQADSTTKIAGIAGTSATGTTSTSLEFQELEPGDEIELSTVNVSTASAVSNFTIGQTYGIKDVSSKTCANLADPSPQLLFKKAVAYPDGSTSYRGIFELVNNAAQFTSPTITGQLETIRIPILFSDPTKGSEVDTGVTLPTKCVIYDVFLDITTAEATGGTKTIDVGTDGSGSNDPDGFLDAASVAATGTVRGAVTYTTGSNETYFASSTMGDLLAPVQLAGADVVGDTGTYIERPDITSGGESVTWTAGSNDFAELVATINIVLMRLA